jgi:hypothetical protein
MKLSELKETLDNLVSGIPTIGLDPTKTDIVISITGADHIAITRIDFDPVKKVFFIKTGI